MNGQAFGARLRALRQVRGLAQLDLGVRAGLSQKHVSFLETGRTWPGRAVVLRLAAGLGLLPGERDALLAAGGYVAADASPMTLDMLGSLRDTVAQVLAQQEPFPGVLVDTAQNILMTNAAFDRLVALAGDLVGGDLWARSCGTGPRNMLRLCFHADGLFPLMTAPERVVPSVLDRVAREALGAPAALTLIEEVLGWPQVARVCRAAPVADAAVIEERYRLVPASDGASVGLVCLIAGLGAPNAAHADQLKLELFHPADADSRAFLLAQAQPPGSPARVDAT